MQDKWIKIGFWVFAATTLFFGVVSINQKIRIQPALGQEDAQNAASGDFNDAKLRVLDTDEDGLNDWEELNVHATSPYLADSDSDGESDSQELLAGTDPNCPAGRVCGSDITQTLEALGQGGGQEGVADEGAPISDFSQESLAGLAALEAGEIPTPSQIRALLQDAGVPQEQIEGTSDEDLTQLFLEVAEQTAEEQ